MNLFFILERGEKNGNQEFAGAKNYRNIRD